MKTNRLVEIRRAWRGNSSRFYSPALWMTDVELEAVAARVKGCPVIVIHRAVKTAEVGSDLLERLTADSNGESNGATQSQATETRDQERKIASRSIKIEAIGDFAYRKIKPRIRLNGRWLEQAGFRPGHRVEIHLPKPGEMTLQFKEQLTHLMLENQGKR